MKERPSKGEHVTWNSLPGRTGGDVQDVAVEDTEMAGKTVRASPGNPKVIAETDSTGKLAAHKLGSVEKGRETPSAA